MKWMAENCALTMPDTNALRQDHVIQDDAHDPDLEIDVDQDHAIVEDLDRDPVEEDDREVVQEDEAEIEEADQIDLVQETENRNLVRVTEVDRADAIVADHVTGEREFLDVQTWYKTT